MTVLAFYGTPDPYADDRPSTTREERSIAPRLAESLPLQIVPEPEPDPAENWRERALCAQVDPELFFPRKGANHTREAKGICGACEVRDQCLLDAVSAFHLPFGVWGGTTQKDRKPLRAAYRLAAARHRRQLHARRAAGQPLRTDHRPHRERTRQSA